jgi:putative membrane protein
MFTSVFTSSALTALALSSALTCSLAQSPDRPRVPMPPAPYPGAPAPGSPAPNAAPPNNAAPNARQQNGSGPREQNAGAMPGAMPAPHQAGSHGPDQVFIIEALRAGSGETDLASLAEQKAGSEQVREFARQMVRDHGQTNSALHRLTEGAPAPDHNDAEHRQIRDALSNLSGPEFDIEYLRLQVQAHQRMAQLMEYEIGSGADVQVQRLASAALPKVFAHLAMARNLLDQVSVQNPQAAGAPPRKASGMPTPQTPRATGN